MNIKQKIVAATAAGFVLGSLLLWGITGFDLLTKNKVPVEVADPLFGTKSIEWRKKFVFGLDLAGPVAGVGIVGGAALLFFLRTRKKNDIPS